MRICIHDNCIDNTSLLNYDEKFLKEKFNYKFVDIDEKYSNCSFEDFDLINNEYVFNLEKYNIRKQNSKLYDLRRRRETECFPIVNRGQLWYDTLTEEQKAELKEWYIAWLDVTDTLVVPNKPNWI